MAYVSLSSLMNTIELEFLQVRLPVILDDDTGQIINSLHNNLGLLLAFLEEYEKKSGIDIKELEAKIKEFALKAEDEIESNLRSIYLDEQDTEMVLCQILQQVAKDTQVFVNIIKRKYYDSSVQDLPMVHTLSTELGLDHESVSLGGSSKVEDRMVGRSSELNTIMDQLTRHPSGEWKVISILGMGGIGKTTLARRVYKDPLVVSHFDVCAWTTVSQEVNVGHMLHDLLCSIRLPTEMNISLSTDELAHELRRRLMGTRYLIVVDDVWETSLWDFLARCFPKSYGSGVLLTTLLKEIVDYTTSGTNLHNLHFLDSNEGWDLFCNHIFLKEPLPSKFETVGRNIVENCQGLPLAIVIAAGLLSQLNKADDLENIKEEISSLVSTDLNEKCSRILTISYNHLPPHLKACFLYLGVFYTNSEIPVKKLVRLWIAEGLVKLVRDKKLEEVGVGYLQDLISRSLVQIDKLKSDGQIKTCRMHDLLHELCVRQARNENPLYVEDNDYRLSKPEHFDMCNNSKKAHGACGCLSFRSSKPKDFDMCNTSKKSRGAFRRPSLRSSKADAFDICNSSKRAHGGFRWLSLRSSKPEHFDMCNNSKTACSVLCLHKDEMPMVNDPKPVNFSLLRVLDLTFPLYTKGYMCYSQIYPI